MRILDELRRELENAAREAERRQEATAQRAPAKTPPNWPKAGRKVAQPSASGRASEMGKKPSQPGVNPTERVGGRLQREPLERTAPALPSIVSAEPTAESYRRKVAQMEVGEPKQPMTTAFDLELEEAAAGAGSREPSPPLAFGPQDIVRALVLGDVIDEPKGRRARRPHPK